MTDAAAPLPRHRVVLPRPPELPPRHPFPFLASLAPVIGSLVIWAITSSPFALVFAFLGPVIAVGTMVDSRLHGKRSLAKGRVTFSRDLLSARAAIDSAHATEARDARWSHPGALAILSAPARDPERWRLGFDHPVEVAIGWADQASALRVDGGDGGDSPEVAELVRIAATVSAPIVVDARLGIGIIGSPVAGWALARGLALQLANLLPPEGAGWEAGKVEAEWLRGLPHAGVGDGRPGELRWSDSAGCAVIAVATHLTELPHGLRVIIAVGGRGGARLLSHPWMRTPLSIMGEPVSRAQADAVAGHLAKCATGRQGAGSLPASVALASLETAVSAGVLEAGFLVGARGVVPLDLVMHGPHALIGGTTGSGKSELLVSWLLSIAIHSSPVDVNFLLVDFKGGASFGSVVGLPHVVGLVTDLDERSAQRALSSLRAEVRYRELRLAAAALRSIDDLAGNDRLPRLVIVVDEFAALVSGFPELHELFADLAARGRSLGMHLVLCTQRPAGVVRDSVLANVPLRLSLRVNNRADSTAVVGTDAAAALPVNPPGRVIVACAGEDPVTAQVALAGSSDVDRVLCRWKGSLPPRRPWCDELPSRVAVESLEAPSSGFTLGLADLPSEQRQATAFWDPAIDGNLLVLGAAGTGKSTLLSLLARQGAEVVPSDLEGAWDTISQVVDSVRTGTARSQILLIDDIDALVCRFGDDHDAVFIELLGELLRTGAAAGVSLAITARRLPARVQSVAASSDCRVLLRHANRQEYQLSGGEAALYSSDSPPGRAEWRGVAVQLASVERLPEGSHRLPPLFEPTGTTLVISPRPQQFAVDYPGCRVVELQASFVPGVMPSDLAPGDELGVISATAPTLVVGNADSWQAHWSHLNALRSTSTLIFDRSSVADFRVFSGSRQLPPPLAPHSGHAWKLQPGRSPTRVRLTNLK